MKIYLNQIIISPKAKGFHIITDEILREVPELKKIEKGLLHLFMMHTSAGLTINENADPTVRADFVTFFQTLVPENPALYKHTDEGPDDMTSHIKTSLFGNSLTIPIQNGRLLLGTWQGIYLCEFRNDRRSRTIVVTVQGEENEK